MFQYNIKWFHNTWRAWIWNIWRYIAKIAFFCNFWPPFWKISILGGKEWSYQKTVFRFEFSIKNRNKNNWAHFFFILCHTLLLKSVRQSELTRRVRSKWLPEECLIALWLSYDNYCSIVYLIMVNIMHSQRTQI